MTSVLTRPRIEEALKVRYGTVVIRGMAYRARITRKGTAQFMVSKNHWIAFDTNRWLIVLDRIEE